MCERLCRILSPPPDQSAPPAEPAVSFGSWDRLSGSTLAVAHPHWRGVRTAARAFGDPVVETEDPGFHAAAIVAGALDAGISTLIVHGAPPGSERLLRSAKEHGLATRVVMHSSMAQHGAEAGEAAMMDSVAALALDGVVDRVGVVKAGLAEAFRALGIPAVHTPNRAPGLPPVEARRPEGPGPHIGVFGALFWRKNVVTQLGAVALLGGTAHVMTRPAVGYLAGMEIVEHGELRWGEFLGVQAGMDLNLYVTLSECHPMGPIESYLSGVPALMSRTSDVFRSDPRLWELTTVTEADEPVAIAAGARTLLEHRDESIERARCWIASADERAASAWHRFVHDTG